MGKDLASTVHIYLPLSSMGIDVAIREQAYTLLSYYIVRSVIWRIGLHVLSTKLVELASGEQVYLP